MRSKPKPMQKNCISDSGPLFQRSTIPNIRYPNP